MEPSREELAADLRALDWRLTQGAGVTSPDDRQNASRGTLGGPVGPYLDKVRHAPLTVTDEEVAGLRAAGHSDDELFELTVVAAYGAARERLDAGLAAVAAAFGEGK